jgi:hypothetical protein
MYAGFNNTHELPATTPGWTFVDHRGVIAIDASDLPAFIDAGWDQFSDISIYNEAVHRLSDLGAVVTHTAHGASHEDFDAEWRMIDIFTVEGDLVCRFEMFDEADLDAALARFDELDRQVPPLENAATRIWVRLADAFNRRDLDGYLALTTSDVRYEDRRKGLRDALEGAQHARKAVQAMFEVVPNSVQMTVETVAIRGSRLSLSRDCFRDTDCADQPITVEALQIAEVDQGGLIRDTVSFDPDDINGAFEELTDRWIASGEVAHPEVIKSTQELTETINRHDWDAFATLSAGATYINHRQLSSPGVETISDHMSSIRTMASLVPNFWVEQADVLAHSAMGVVTHVVVRGTSTDGATIEIPLIQLALFEGDHVTHVEAFDPDQRRLALARFDELNRSR